MPGTPHTQHTVGIQQVQNILKGAVHHKLDVAPLLAQAGIPAALLESPLARISQGQYSLLIRSLRRALRDELWGLMSHPLAPGSFGQCMHRLVRAGTLEQALREGFSFYHLLLQDFSPRLTVHEDTAQVQLVARRAVDARLDYAIKAFMLFTFNAASWLVARRIPLLTVDYTDTSSSSDTSRVYQVPVRHVQHHVGISFAAHWLGLPVVQSAQSLREFLAGSPANLIVKYRDHGSVTDRIRRLLRKRLGGGGSPCGGCCASKC